MKSFLHQAFTLARVSNLPTVWTNVLAAWAINATASSTFKIMPEVCDFAFFDWNTFVYLLIGSSLIYAGGCTLNDAFDQDFDQAHNPTTPIAKRFHISPAPFGFSAAWSSSWEGFF